MVSAAYVITFQTFQTLDCLIKITNYRITLVKLKGSHYFFVYNSIQTAFKSRRQSYKIFLILKKTNLVSNFLVVGYLNSGCIRAESSKLRSTNLRLIQTFLRLNIFYGIASRSGRILI